MKDSRINYVVVGAFVLAMVAGLIVVLGLLAGRTGATETYHTVYDNVGGLKFGTQVLYEGYPIGQVEAITPQPEDGVMRFRVDLAVQEGWVIPQDSVARMAASGLLSAITIDIKGGRSTEAVPPGGMIPGGSGGSIFTAMSELAGQVDEIAEQGVLPLLDKLNAYTDELGTTAVDHLPEIAANLRKVSETLATDTPAITRNLAGFSEKLDRKVLSPDNVQGLERIISNSEEATRRFTAMAATLEEMSGKVQGLIVTLDGVVEKNEAPVGAAVEDLRYSLDAIARNIDSITYNMDATSRNMMEFSRSIRQNPGLLLGGTPPEDEEGRR